MAKEQYMKNIYLAGKVSKNDWRHSIVPDLRESVYDWDEDFGCCAQPNLSYAKLNLVINNKLKYIGPIMVGDDHGCFHGETMHGAILKHNPTPEARHLLFLANQKALHRADIVVAYIESLDCYGTLVELGFAHANNIPIHLMYSQNIFSDLMYDRQCEPQKPYDTHVHDFWYVEKMCETVSVETASHGISDFIDMVD